jgi:magnesium-transporting ATPase (P-type)
MYSESNFSNFKETLLQLNSDNKQNEIKLANEYAKDKVNCAQKESEEFFETSIQELKKELENLKKKELVSLEINFTRKQHLLIKKQTYKIRHMLKNRIDKEFDFLSECFLKKISAQFDEGDLKLYKKFDTIDLKKFNISYPKKKKIVFTKQNIYIEFSVELILREYHEIIKEKIVNFLGE